MTLQKQAERAFQSGQDKLEMDDYEGAIADFQSACRLDPEVSSIQSLCPFCSHGHQSLA